MIYFPNAEALIGGAKVIIQQAPECTATSILYRAPRGYDLQLTLTRKKLQLFQHSFSAKTDPVYLAAVAEYEPIICDKAALDKIRKAFL